MTFGNPEAAGWWQMDGKHWSRQLKTARKPIKIKGNSYFLRVYE
jgi:hypothetical protein